MPPSLIAALYSNSVMYNNVSELAKSYYMITPCFNEALHYRFAITTQ